MTKDAIALLASVPLLAGSLAAFDPPSRKPLVHSRAHVLLPNGINLSYLEAGESTGESVILLHGFTDTSRSFLGTLEALASNHRGLRVFALDARGHGASSMPAGDECPSQPERCFEFADFASDVVAFMDATGLRRAHVVGHSMGSAIAQELALSSPERVASLVLIDAFVRGADNPVIRDFLRRTTIEGAWKQALERRPGFHWPEDAYHMTPLDADPNAEAWNAANWVVDPTADPALIHAIVPETSRIRLGTWIGAVRSQEAFDSAQRLAQLTVPTLVLWATQDSVFTAEPDQARLRAALDAAAGACRTTYFYKVYGKQALPASGQQESDLGHNLMWGAPEVVAADIAAFIQEGRPTSDLAYADPADVRSLRVDRAAARIETGPACGS
jgi:pimeloyl-ACP methyl ester carboxylesterase